MLTQQKGFNDKCGIGYYNSKHNYKSQTTFVKSVYKHRRCLLIPIVAKNTFPYELRLHAPTNVRTTVLSRIPFLMN